MAPSPLNDKFIPRDENLRQYATDRQWEILEAYWQEGTGTKAAKKLGLKSRTSIAKTFQKVWRRAARHGYNPRQKAWDIPGATPEGMVLRGQSALLDADGNLQQRWDKTKQAGMEPEDALQLPDPKKTTKLSTMYDADGKVVVQWQSEKPEDAAREQAWADYARELAADLPRVEPVAAPAAVADDLCVCIPVGDLHIGMLAWHEENGGNNFNLDECERLFAGAIDYLVSATPAAGTCLLAILGDFVHADSHKPVTPQHGHQLDVDSRPSQRVRVAIRLARYAIDAAARKYGRVRVIVEIGNHDLYTAIFLMEALAAMYESEPRVDIDTSPRHYHYFRFGKVLLGTHHGDRAKLQDLPLIMAADRPSDWGETKFRYWWTCHVHHRQRLSGKETGGVYVESVQVLGPADAHADREGYRSMRSLQAVTYHADHGETGRIVVNPEMLL